MKDKIIVRKGKNYLESSYKEFNWLVRIGVIVLVFFVAVNVFAFLSPPTIGYAGDMYLKVDDAGRDSIGCYVVGDMYIWEAMVSGGFHDNGERMIVGVTEFVYDQLEEGNVISLSIDSGGDYQYGGDIYGSVDSFPTTDDLIDPLWEISILLIIYISAIWLIVLLTKRDAEVIVSSNVKIIKKIRTWYGMYSYLECDEGLFRLKDERVYIKYDVGDTISVPRLYALRENLKKIKNKSVELENLMDDMEKEM